LTFVSRAEFGDNHNKNVLKLYKDKLSINQIVKKLHLKKPSVYMIIRRQKIRNRKLAVKI